MSHGFLVTTTGLQDPVVLLDLGIQLSHPTIGLDLELQFEIETLKNSPSILAALDAGWITVEDAQGGTITSSTDIDQVGTEHEIGSHKHVDTTGLSDADVLRYDGTGQQWTVGPVAADEVTYSNTASGLAAVDVQAALDEIEARVDLADDYAGKFEIPNITTIQIPTGKWGWWWDTVNLKLYNVRNRLGVLYAVEATPLP